VDRAAALQLNRGLMQAADIVEAGETGTKTIVAAVHAQLVTGLDVEYVALAGQDLVQPLHALDRPAFLALAAWAGETRLIDNVHFDAGDDGFVADRGVRLDQPSVLYGTGEG
jgi:pantothenate synthetase